MDMTEKQLSSEYKFRGRIMTARVDEVSLPNGKTAPREVCEHVGGVGVLPIAEVEKMIERDEIRDAKTVAAMYRAKLKNLY